MDKKKLQNILSSAYNMDTWREVLVEYFGAKKFFQTPQLITLPGNELVEVATEIGNFYTADERLVGIYEVKLTPKAWIDKNRVGLRNILRTVYKYDVDGALIVFVQDEKWRFSYVSEIRTEEGKKETEPKRYTYLFGKGESCRTAADRFDKLKGSPIYLNDLFDAFSVEKLNKDFFKSYKEYFESFSDHLAKQSKYRQILLGTTKELEKGWKDEKAKPIRNFSKKLMGRIVFLQFLQKKGWMGVPATNNDWVGGDAKFLQNLFLTQTDQAHFHSKALKTLFFETLNSKRDNQLAPESLGANIKIPYLNGGLFDKDISFDNEIDFPIELFRNLLDFFEQYNFTIDENDPFDSEVGIDPEMLGHIFENLLEENREKGAFYTPKEIVHYMCHESLIEYLHTQFPEFEKADFENLVRNNHVADCFSNYKTANEINEKLKSVKICDPSIGSGAFPMGMLKEIYECRRLLYGYLRTNETFDPAVIKKEIIQQNIYGVDIENGAVEIARLRFWLALVVDEKVPQPLPNLDYKIMQGNSLLESFEGIDLSTVHTVSRTTTVYEPQKDLFGRILNPQLEISDNTILQENDLQALMKSFFNETEADKKLALRQTITQTVHDHIDYNLEMSQLSYERQIAEAPDRNQPGLKTVTKKKVGELHAQLENLIEKRRKLNELQHTENKPYFLWHLFFADVFENGGFDIVIGNPPYIQLQKGGGELAKTYQNIGFETFDKTGDIYALFFEVGNSLLKSKGLICYITSNQWLQTNYGKILKKYFINHTNPYRLINFGGLKVFESATVDTSIFITVKEKCKFSLNASHFKNGFKLSHGIAEYFENNSVLVKDLEPDKWLIANDIITNLKSKIKSKGKFLKNWDIEISRGIITGFNEAFIIDNVTKNKLIIQDKKNAEVIKPVLRGRDVHKNNIQFADLYLIHTHNGIKSENCNTKNKDEKWEIKPINVKEDYPFIYSYLMQFEEELIERQDKGYHFTNLRNCTYFDKFDQPKIIYPETTVRRSEFYLDNEGFYIDKTCFMITGKNLQYINAVLSSKCIEWYLETELRLLGKKSIQYSKQYIDYVPVPDIEDESLFVKIIGKIIKLNKDNLPTNDLENKIDALVFQLYGLTEGEMLQVLDTFPALSITDRNKIHTEYLNIANGTFENE